MSRITDYPALAAPVTDDVLLGVDVHDTTQSAAGSTKKVAVSDLLGFVLAPAPSGGDDYAAVQPVWSAAMTAGTPFRFRSGVYLFSQPLPAVTVNGWDVGGAGRWESAGDAGTLLRAQTGSSRSNWPQGTGLITVYGSTAAAGNRAHIHDLGLDGNSVAFNEISVIRTEGTTRHHVERIVCAAKSVGPSVWIIGTEDCLFEKLQVTGSEANPSNLKLGLWASVPGGTIFTSGCDFLCPVAVRATNWDCIGNNAGTLLIVNGPGSQTNTCHVIGAWMFDGAVVAGGHVYSPVDCVIGGTDGAMTSGSATFNSATGGLTSDMTGNELVVYPPGAASPLTGTLTYVSATQATASFTNSTGADITGAFWVAQGGWLSDTVIDECRMVATSTGTWINGKLPGYAGIYLGARTQLATAAANANSAMTILNLPSGSSNYTSFKIGEGGVRLNTSKTNITVVSGSPSASHATEIRGPLSSLTTSFTYSGLSVLRPAPAVPASTTPYINVYAVPMDVTTTGGTVTGVAVNGVSLLSGNGTVTVPPAGTITLTYSSAPTWTWTQHLG